MIPKIEKFTVENLSISTFLELKRHFPELIEEIKENASFKIRKLEKEMKKEIDIVSNLLSLLFTIENESRWNPMSDLIKKEIVHHYDRFNRKKAGWMRLYILVQGGNTFAGTIKK